MADGGKKPSNYDEVMDEKMRKKTNEAYKNASRIGPYLRPPEPKRGMPPRPKMEPPDPRGSVRDDGFTEEMEGEKKGALDQGLKGAKKLISPMAVASAMGPAAAVAMPKGTFKKPVDDIMSAADKYRGARNALNSADREMEAQDRRESRMAKGGSVSSASKRADGCAQKGKTKGRMV
jgi:hypothetical protein